MTVLPTIRKSAGRRNRTGAAMILMLLLLMVIVGMAAFAIDIGLMSLLRAEVQNAVDAGALAASLKLQQDHEAIPEAEAAARQFVQLNRAGMSRIIPEDAIDVEPGRFDSEKNTFSSPDDTPNAVRVFARQDSQPFFFAKIWGQTTFGAPASAIAAGDPSPLDVMMVLDLSGSMSRSGRIQALWRAAPKFVDVIEQLGGDDRIGVMGLSANPDVYDPAALGHSGMLYSSGLHPTGDYNVGVLEAVLDDNFSYLRNVVLRSSNLQAGKYTRYTGTGAAIGDAAHYLTSSSAARDEAEKAIVLMSDGRANRPSSNGPGYARAMAGYAAARDVTIYTISLGNDADVNLMRDIAALTDGIHFDATGSGVSALTERLTKAFEEAAAAMKRAQLVK